MIKEHIKYEIQEVTGIRRIIYLSHQTDVVFLR